MRDAEGNRSQLKRGSWIRVLLLSGAAVVQAQQVQVPQELEGWRGWALQGAEYRRCPFLVSRSATDANSYRCAWPERLELALDAHGGRFSQGWQVYAASWVVLPGDADHWPLDLEANGAPLAAVLRDGVPQARLDAGHYAISGRLGWTQRPEQLAVAQQTALVDLTLDGLRIAQPERPNGAVWLGKRRTAESARGLDLQVYRLVEDEIPVQLTTRVQLQVSGEGREEVLAAPLPAGFTPLRLTSELAARLDAAGRLHVQVRPGSFGLELVARGPGVAAAIARPQAPGTWARDEVWSFAGADRLRVAAPEGGDAIDPAQAGVPADWRGHPAFRLAPGGGMRIVERSRGIAAADDNHLTLRREQWLDFDHRAYTAVDSIQGTLRNSWRLDMARALPARARAQRRGQPAGHRGGRQGGRRAAHPTAAAAHYQSRAAHRRRAAGQRLVGALRAHARRAAPAARPSPARCAGGGRRAGHMVVAMDTVEPVRRADRGRLHLPHRRASGGGGRGARAGADVPGGAVLHLAVGEPAGRGGGRQGRGRRPLWPACQPLSLGQLCSPRRPVAAAAVGAAAIRDLSAARGRGARRAGARHGGELHQAGAGAGAPH